MKIIKLFAEKGMQGTLQLLSPAVFSTKHVKKESKKDGNLVRIFNTLAQVLYLFIKKKKTVSSDSKQVLFYSPNGKYDQFCSVLENELDDNFITLAERKYNSTTVDPQELTTYMSNRFQVFRILPYMRQIRKIAKEKNEMAVFNTHYWLVLSLLRKDLFLTAFFQKNKFRFYFSFHPIGDLHMLTNQLYQDQFKTRYSIRPTTTYTNVENQFISSEVLYYKSEREREIYEASISANIQLKQGGIILSETKAQQDNANGLLFIDTCTNSNPDSPEIRINAIRDFLETAKELQQPIYFKFHPGLLENLKIETLTLISESKLNNFQVVDQIPFHEIRMCVSFDSSVMFQCIEKGLFVINLAGEYDLFPAVNSEFADASIPRIENKNEFQKLCTIDNNNNFNDIVEQQLIWLKTSYNYPAGMQEIVSNLLEIEKTT